MEDTLKHLFQIEEASGRIMDRVELQKEACRKEYEEKTAAFDEQMKREKEAKKKQHVVEIKEIRLTPNIDTNDLNTKINAARKFLKEGDRVKVTLRFRGREMAHMQTSKHILDDFAEGLADSAVVEKAPKVEGRSMTMFLAGKKN